MYAHFGLQLPPPVTCTVVVCDRGYYNPPLCNETCEDNCGAGNDCDPVNGTCYCNSCWRGADLWWTWVILMCTRKYVHTYYRVYNVCLCVYVTVWGVWPCNYVTFPSALNCEVVLFHDICILEVYRVIQYRNSWDWKIHCCPFTWSRWSWSTRLSLSWVLLHVIHPLRV